METLTITERLLRKYTSAVPRYTSYPAIPFWGETSEAQVAGWLGAEPATADRSLSLYFHIPFCTKRCHYCGCFVVITPHKEQGNKYLQAVQKEVEMVHGHLAPERPVRQFHLGGGTPTFLDPEVIADLVATTRERFDFEPDVEMSIEVDPRSVSAADLARLREVGFNRLSFGVQDFDPAVQRAVNRVQPFEMVAALVEAARAQGYLSVNFDLIYGLPAQTRASFARTMEQVQALRPDRLAIYHYAHLPDNQPHQRKIDPALLPSTEEKSAIFLAARQALLEAGYRALGLDHFALPEDDLMRAYEAGTMRRNFMGYTTQAGVDLLAFGLSGISEFSGGFWQNEKKLAQYYRAIEAGKLPVVRGLALTAEDRLRKGLIGDIFCKGGIDYGEVQQRFGIDPPRHLAAEMAALAPMAADGLVVLNGTGMRVTERGQLFLRNIAAVFDAYLVGRTAGKVAFSRTF